MKLLFMMLSTVMWLTISFVVTNTLYAEGGRIEIVGDYYFVDYTEKPTKVVMHNYWHDPSRIVY